MSKFYTQKNCSQHNTCGNSDKHKKKSPYLSGSRTIFIEDKTRPFDAFGLGVPDANLTSPSRGSVITADTRGTRILVTNVWYPVDRKSCIKKKYRKSFFYDFYFASGPNDTQAYNAFLNGLNVDGYSPEKANVASNNMAYLRVYKAGVTSNTDPRYLEATQLAFQSELNSYKDAPISKAGKFPVIILAHGNGDTRISFYRIGEYLASQGYMVMAFDSTGTANQAFVTKDPLFAQSGNDFLFDSTQPGYAPNGFINAFGAYEIRSPPPVIGGSTNASVIILRIQRNQMVVDDFNTILKELVRLDSEHHGFFRNSIDLCNIGTGGHSLGGGCAVARQSVANIKYYKDLPQVKAVFGQNAGAFLTSDFLRVITSTIDFNTLPFLQTGYINYVRVPVLNTPVYFYTGKQDDTLVRLQSVFVKTNGVPTPLPTALNPQPTTRETYELSTAPAYYSTYENSLHNTVNSFNPYQLFSRDFNPQMPDILSTQAYSLYVTPTQLVSTTSAGILIPDPNSVFTPVSQSQFQRIFRFLNQNFYDAFLKCETKDAFKIVKQRIEPRIRIEARNLCLLKENPYDCRDKDCTDNCRDDCSNNYRDSDCSDDCSD